VTLLFSEIEGRFYGGGVLELTPSEFRSLPLYYLEPTPKDFLKFLSSRKWSDPISLAKAGDDMLHRHFGFSRDQLRKFHEAWIKLRLHRLRHGRSSAL
jgi:hypothetical protein